MLNVRTAAGVLVRGLHSGAGGLQAPKSALAKLRKKTGYSLSLCKKALEQHEQDVLKAEEWLKASATFAILDVENNKLLIDLGSSAGARLGQGEQARRPEHCPRSDWRYRQGQLRFYGRAQLRDGFRGEKRTVPRAPKRGCLGDAYSWIQEKP